MDEYLHPMDTMDVNIFPCPRPNYSMLLEGTQESVYTGYLRSRMG